MDEHNCTLINLGESLRVLYDVNQKHVKIPPGSIKRATLPDVTIQFIAKSMSTDPLCVLTDSVELPPDMVECLSIMAAVSTDDYDEVLQRTAKLVGNENLGKTKPTRGEILGLLKTVVEKYQKVTIKEQVPTRDDPRRTPAEQLPEAPDRSKPDDEPKPKAAPPATQTSYKTRMAETDDKSDGVLDIAIEPPAKGKAEVKAVPKTKKRQRVRI